MRREDSGASQYLVSNCLYRGVRILVEETEGGSGRFYETDAFPVIDTLLYWLIFAAASASTVKGLAALALVVGCLGGGTMAVIVVPFAATVILVPIGGEIGRSIGRFVGKRRGDNEAFDRALRGEYAASDSLTDTFRALEATRCSIATNKIRRQSTHQTRCVVIEAVCARNYVCLVTVQT